MNENTRTEHNPGITPPSLYCKKRSPNMEGGTGRELKKLAYWNTRVELTEGGDKVLATLPARKSKGDLWE